MSSFSHVLVTCPNEACAGVYLTQLREASRLSGALSFLKSVPVHCVPDPQGARIGSGGGTLNAIDHLLQIIGREQLAGARVLIVHSGGDSQRSPMHTVCGKAFATINCHVGENKGESAPYATSIALLIRELNATFSNLPEGSITVASSDVMLSFRTEASSPAATPTIPSDGCSVVVVPEDINVARNHGVLVEDSAVSSTGGSTSVAREYLQKPSLSAMVAKGACINGDDRRVLIDTGVVLFTGRCAAALVSLLEDPFVSGCTARAIESGRRPALRLELYSDLLQALAPAGRVRDVDTFFASLGEGLRANDNSDKARALQSIHRALSAFNVYSISFREGLFGHLGTSEELLAFVNTCNRGGGDIGSSEDDKFKRFAAKYCLQGRVSARLDNRSAHCVAVNSFVSCNVAAGEIVLGMGSFVEHSVLACRGVRLDVGSGCVLSHLSSPFAASVAVIGSALMLQQVRIVGSGYTLILLGVRDNIKAAYTDTDATVCGASWHSFFTLGGVGPDEVWEPTLPQQARTLWTARLFAVKAFSLDQSSDDAIDLTSLWFQHCIGDDHSLATTDEFKEAVATWRSSRRVSLSDIISCGDAAAMNLWRGYIKSIMDDGNIALLDDSDRCIECFRLVTNAVSPQLLPVSAALALWLLRLCSGRVGVTEQQQLRLVRQLSDSDSTSALSAFEIIWSRSRGSSAVLALLLRLADDSAVMHASQAALAAASSARLPNGSLAIPAEMHPRMLLLTAHVLRDSGLHIDSEAFASISLDLDARGMDSAQARSVCDRAGSIAMTAVRECICVSGSSASSSGDNLQLTIEALAQRLICAHTKCSLDTIMRLREPSPRLGAIDGYGRVAVARAPVRIDLCGGWSDTPPITYETTGAVLNCAVLIDNKYPISCLSRVTRDAVIVLHSLRVGMTDSGLCGEAETCTMFSSFADATNPAGPWSLLKACLLALDIVPQQQLGCSDPATFSAHLQSAYGGGLEIACLSDLPAGSGMGGSSILAAAVLQSLSELLQLQLTASDLVYLVSQVEQIMTTGGGWQDQVGAIYGGFKVGSSAGPLWNMHTDLRRLVSQLDLLMDAALPGDSSSSSSSSSSGWGGLPLRVDVLPCAVAGSFAKRFGERTFLVRLHISTLPLECSTYRLNTLYDADIYRYATSSARHPYPSPAYQRADAERGPAA